LSKPKINNSLYYHTKSLLNGILPLEYAIRAFKENDPTNYQYLCDKNEIIKNIWTDAGFSEEEIKWEKLLDLSWDLIQVGGPLYRMHGRFHNDFSYLELIEKTSHKIYKESKNFLENKSIPLIKRYRIVDLLHGNDIERLVSKIVEKMPNFKEYGKDDDIPLENFILGKFREAILLYPGSKFMQLDPYEEIGVKVPGYALFLDINMEYDHIESAINEFKYQYAKYREAKRFNDRDDVARKMLNDFLHNDLMNSNLSQEVIRIDGLLSGPLGLYCYDIAIKNKENTKSGYLKEAIEQAIACSPNSNAESVEKYYKNVKNKIKNQWDIYSLLD
jgi:hypothetical protein